MLSCALEVFDPPCIFVCDNGRDLSPTDHTHEVCKEVVQEKGLAYLGNINYVYVPEGNKTLALYWTSALWIPHLVKSNPSVRSLVIAVCCRTAPATEASPACRFIRTLGTQ